MDPVHSWKIENKLTGNDQCDDDEEDNATVIESQYVSTYTSDDVTYPLKTHKISVIANCPVGLQNTWWTLDSTSVTETLSATSIVITTFIALVIAAVVVTARTLAWTAQSLGSTESAGDLVTGVFGSLRPATILQTVLFPTTVTLLALLHNSITANGNFRL